MENVKQGHCNTCFLSHTFHITNFNKNITGITALFCFFNKTVSLSILTKPLCEPFEQRLYLHYVRKHVVYEKIYATLNQLINNTLKNVFSHFIVNTEVIHHWNITITQYKKVFMIISKLKMKYLLKWCF